MEKKVSDLFGNGYLFVKHHLTTSEKKRAKQISRGLPHLRTLRDIMDEVYRLLDRRCRSDTALAWVCRDWPVSLIDRSLTDNLDFSP